MVAACSTIFKNENLQICAKATVMYRNTHTHTHYTIRRIRFKNVTSIQQWFGIQTSSCCQICIAERRGLESRNRTGSNGFIFAMSLLIFIYLFICPLCRAESIVSTFHAGFKTARWHQHSHLIIVNPEVSSFWSQVPHHYSATLEANQQLRMKQVHRNEKKKKLEQLW